MADRRDLDPAPPARRTATPAAARPAPELAGPGTARGFAQRDTESAAPGTAAAGPGHDPALAPRHPPAPLGRQIQAGQDRPADHPWSGQRVSPGRVTWMRFSAPTGHIPQTGGRRVKADLLGCRHD